MVVKDGIDLFIADADVGVGQVKERLKDKRLDCVAGLVLKLGTRPWLHDDACFVVHYG